jgi:hypothetical protein
MIIIVPYRCIGLIYTLLVAFNSIKIDIVMGGEVMIVSGK